VSDNEVFGRMCPHCRASDTRRLGECWVCDRAVCEACGNVQVSMGKRRVLHNECLKKADGGFSMIKFVQ
jgi:hypothetical protein